MTGADINNGNNVSEETNDGNCMDKSVLNQNGSHLEQELSLNGSVRDTCLHNEETEEKAKQGGLEEEQDGAVTDNAVGDEEGRYKDEEVTVEALNKAPDGGWGWWIVIGALIVRTVIGGMGRSHGLFYIKFKDRYQGSATSTALVTSLTGFIRMSTGPIVSILSGRFQGRVLTALGAATLFVGLILTEFAPNLEFLYFSYGVVAGLGRSLALTPVPILLGFYFDKRRSLAFGLASAGFSIGGFAITPIVELMFQHYGYQGTFFILSGFACNILVASALFRPIELHRKLMSVGRSKGKEEQRLLDNRDREDLHTVEQMESGDVLSSSTISLTRIKDDKGSNLQGKNQGKEQDTDNQGISEHTVANNMEDNSEKPKDKVKVIMELEHKEKLLNGEFDKVTAERRDVGQRCSLCKLCCFCNKSNDVKEEDGSKKKKLISWSILKDTRFLCYLFATFCFILPNGLLFLPSLGKSKGLSEIEAASLLSVGAGADTLFRIISGFVLDLKVFRSIRPQIFGVITLLNGILQALYPFVRTLPEFMVLCFVDGAVQGIKNAQGIVVVMDMLGVDKLASSLAMQMAVQCIGIFLGPTISGQLIDASGKYDAAFYFASGTIILGALVMIGGNIAKYCRDKKNAALKKSEETQETS